MTNDTVRINLTISSESYDKLSALASERKRGQFISDLIMEHDMIVARIANLEAWMIDHAQDTPC